MHTFDEEGKSHHVLKIESQVGEEVLKIKTDGTYFESD